MMLTVLKHGGTWDFFGRMFGVKGPTFERLITNFLHCIAEPFYDKWVTDYVDKYTMDFCLQNDRKFKNFPYARYATDVTFQESNRPSGNIAEGKKYFSGKHKLYGFKVEVSVLCTGLAIGCTDHEPGSVADIDIFYKNACFHEECLRKTEKDGAYPDDGLYKESFPNIWAVLLDKGYQGAIEVVRAIHPKKKPRNGFLTVAEEQQNKLISSDRIIVENFFGRLCGLWTILSSKFRWSEGIYDVIFNVCLALTNAHIRRHPLRAEDAQFYNRFKNRQYGIGETKAEKRRKIQKKYREKRKRRMARMFWGDSDDETQEP